MRRSRHFPPLSTRSIYEKRMDSKLVLVRLSSFIHNLSWNLFSAMGNIEMKKKKKAPSPKTNN